MDIDWNAMIAAVPPSLLALAALVQATKAKEQSTKAKEQATQTHNAVNGHLVKMMKLLRRKAIAEGVVKEQDAALGRKTARKKARAR